MTVQLLLLKERDNIYKTFTIKMPEPECTKCHSKDCAFYEVRKVLRGESTRYKCRKCGHRFTFAPGELGRHYPRGTIADALNDVCEGKSQPAAARGIERQLQIKLGTEKVRSPCSQTVGRWIRDTNKQFQKMMECIPIQVGSNWNADEIFFKSDGEDRWLFGVMDSESRFLLW